MGGLGRDTDFVEVSDGTKPRRHGVKRPDLQGMRAVAVLTVFANHLFGWPSGGFVGVDIFFVLSGFLIMAILRRELRGAP